MGVVHEIELETTQKEQVIDVTSRIQEIIASLNIKNGFVCVYVPHSTAAVSIHKELKDGQNFTLTEWLDELDKTKRASHIIKAALIAPTEILIVRDSKLEMDVDQRIYFYEFDGPKKRKILVYITE